MILTMDDFSKTYITKGSLPAHDSIVANMGLSKVEDFGNETSIWYSPSQRCFVIKCNNYLIFDTKSRSLLTFKDKNLARAYIKFALETKRV
jgi:hypothetical protein